MKNRKVRAQQIIMTVGCIGFLVWVGLRGMNERQGNNKSTDTTTSKALSLVSEGVRVEPATDEIVVVNQSYPTQISTAPSFSVLADQSGELVQVMVDVNSRIEVGQDVALLRVAVTQGDTLGLGKATKKVKDAKQHVKEQLELLLAIDRGEEGTAAKENYEKQYASYNEAKKTLTSYEEQVNKISSSTQQKYVEHTIKAKQTGTVKQVLVGAGNSINQKQPLLTMQAGQSQAVQIQVTSENYLLLRNYANQLKGSLLFKDESTYALPNSVLATLNQKSINEEGNIVMTLNVASIPNRQDIQKLTLSVLNVPTRVFNEKAIFMRDNTAYVWTVNEEDRITAVPVMIVKNENEKVYVQRGNTPWNRVLVGDLTQVKEGDKLTNNE
ncbi:efflux RND transporter periplasmic adaptor subunit [Myroides sp. WP-1]|uniref:efflux RND transporter periplasmic adaptor subunit n=1 Tax=Myroides sp. WP-1 TaxID=2759944 RepID=UPI0015FE532C|nr:efflux RND transporter periplasmic adaptor subunit [Myroides sp. WP-1]MBB1138984.1 efflux RND transporter periplasmic adaptor subunit [Myroides sp. WP-1]